MKPEIKLKDTYILVTGGAGFIGSNLCEYLLSCEATITCLDNFATGKENNIKKFLDHPRFTLIKGDIRDLETCQRACKNQEFVLHQAALGSVPRSINDPISSNEVNVSGFLNMLVAARDQKVKRFIFAASSSTYGDSKKLPKVEDEIGQPLSPYAITKYTNELYANIFQRTYGLNYIGLRYFNVFGRQQDPHGAYAAVIPLFIKKLMNYESPIINGDGKFSRDFTHIENVIHMNVLCMISENTNALNQIYNTASGIKTSLNDLVTILRDCLSIKDEKIVEIKTSNGPTRKGDIPHSLASISKAYRLLGYKPICKFNDGVEKTVNWFWNNKKK
jgi:UDP-N-acetylglucosamine 4-epimerase|tara:strand:+ start:2467 stop:3462 length:996 start_codon:yes stop_codon:yes gene_type:complete